MSVVSSNRFAFLDEDHEETPAPAPKKAAPAPAPAAPAAVAKPSRGDYPSRGAPRKAYQGDREATTDGTVAGFEGKEERGPRGARDGRGGRGGPRGGRGGSNPRSNGGTYLGGDRPRRENGGGRPFDRQSQTAHKDSDKAEAAGWGPDEGKSELQAEVLGEADAKGEATPAGAATPAAAPATPVVEEEDEDKTQTYEEYLAAQAAKKLTLAALPEARSANEGADETAWKNTVALARKGTAEEEWFVGKKPAEPTKARKVKEAKTFIEIEANFKPPRRDGPPREGGERGGRGGARGGGRGRGDGAGRGRGAAGPRGAPRSTQATPVNVADVAAFPALS